MSVKILQGDCVERMRELPDECVHCAVTSPPYFGLRSYLAKDDPLKPYEAGTEPTPEEYVKGMVEVFREVRRVLRKDGTLWLNLGDSYASKWPCNRRNVIGNGSLDDGTRTNRPERGVGNGIKEKDLIGIPHRVAFALQADGWYLRAICPWCLSHSTRVYAKTQKGEMPMTVGEMVRLKPESVKLWTGLEWSQVTGFKESNAEKGIEILLRSGQRISCTAEHLWPTERGEVSARDLCVGDQLKSVVLPPPKTAPIDSCFPSNWAWVVGFFIAEGHLVGDVQAGFSMNSKEQEAASRLEAAAKFFGGTVSVFDDGAKRIVSVYGRMFVAAIRIFVTDGSCKTKHLKTAAWQRGNEFLKTLLGAYLDGDGAWDEKANRWRLGFCRNDALASDLRTLCARLGYSLRLKRCQHKNQTGLFYGFKGDLRFDKSKQVTSDTEIIGLQISKSKKFWDVNIESPHLFALASGVLTHNCKRNGMPESTRDRPTQVIEYVFLLSKSPKYYYDAEAVKLPGVCPAGTKGAKGSAARAAQEGVNARPPEYKVYDGKRARRTSDWFFESQGLLSDDAGAPLAFVVNTTSYKGAHFATFPAKLIEPCILASTSEKGCCSVCEAPWERVIEKDSPARDWRDTDTPRSMNGGNSQRSEGVASDVQQQSRPTRTVGWKPTCTCNAQVEPCVVLDPFLGSGTTAQVAQQHGRNAIGIELNPAYIPLIEERTGVAA